MRRFGPAVAIAFLLAVPLHAEQKNVKVLTGLSDFELVRAMQVMRSSLGVGGCDFCHALAPDGKSLDFASDAKKEKETARKMIAMTKAINEQNFTSRPTVSCETCHRGSTDPVGILPLPQPLPPERNAESTQAPAARPVAPTRDEVVAKYAAAIGHPAAALWESRHMVGTREGSDGKPLPMTIEESPAGVHTTVKLENETMEQGATSTAGWTRNAKGARPFSAPELALLHSLANAFAPPLPEAIPANARVFQRTAGGRDAVLVVFASTPGTRERLEFDPSTGLLRRRTILIDTPVGVAPIEADFEDWRDVGGSVKYPFTIKVSPYEPRVGSTRHYSEVTLGAKLDEKTLSMPQ